jgi:hypothetical protein
MLWQAIMQPGRLLIIGDGFALTGLIRAHIQVQDYVFAIPDLEALPTQDV